MYRFSMTSYKVLLVNCTVLFSLVVLVNFSMANPPPKVVKAHNHGVSTWSLAFEDKIGKLMIETPTESVLPFEREPKNRKEIKIVNETLKNFESKMPLMIQFPKQLSCVWKKVALDVLRDENDKSHSEIEGEFEITCQTEPTGAEIVFNIQKYFPKFKSANIEILYGNIQKSFVSDRSGIKVQLK